ncbi:MAG: hypothetical protein ABW321_15755 [Polyangiales bacterium]
MTDASTRSFNQAYELEHDAPTENTPVFSDVRELRPAGGRVSSPYFRDPGQAPVSTYSYHGADFEVYTVKTDAEAWPASQAALLAAECRQARTRTYGERAPILDSHDAKSNVYLVRSQFRDDESGEWCEEWQTTRNVPITGRPYGLEEFELYRSRSRPESTIPQLMVEAGLAESEEDVGRHTFSNGGTGAIRPVTESGRPLAANRFSWEAMLVAMRQFFDECTEREVQCQTVLFQISPKLARHYVDLPMTRMDETCGLPADDLHIYRGAHESRELCYAVPGYFLDADDMAKLLGALIEEDAIDPQVIARLLPHDRSLHAFLTKPRFTDMRAFGALFDTDTPLRGCQISPEEMRALADLSVRTSPVLWRFRLDELIAKTLEPTRTTPPAAAPQKTFKKPTLATVTPLRGVGR